jgi:choline-sulfatase
VPMREMAPWTDGESLLPVINGTKRLAPVLMEYAAEGSYAPLVGIREGQWKYIHCTLDPEQLYDLDADPLELTNLAHDPAHAATLARFQAFAQARWDMARFDEEVRESQARRWVVYEALRNGSYYPWDYQPLQKASERYMRNHMNLDNLENDKRYPRGE